MELLLSHIKLEGRRHNADSELHLQITAQGRLRNGRQISALSVNLAKQQRKFPGLKGSIISKKHVLAVVFHSLSCCSSIVDVPPVYSGW